VHATPVPNTVGHDMVGQVLGLGQLTSQAHDTAQSTDAQACAEQLIEHAPGPQLMLWHAAAPWHSMSQLLAAAQSMSPQPPALHLKVHSKPTGQCRLPHASPDVQSTLQVMSWTSHDVHGDGQPLLEPPMQ